MLNLSDIKVNTSDVTAGQSLAAYLTDAAGALITSTLVAGKQRADVNTASEYAEDSAHTSGDLGSFALAVRHDANTSLVSADGDYAPLQVDAAGALKVSGSLTAVFTAEHNEDDPFTDGDSGVAVLTVRQDALAISTSADGDYGSLKTNDLGELWVRDSTVHSDLVGTNLVLSSIWTDTTTISNTLTALSKAEDSAFTDGDQGIPALLVRQDTLAVSTSANGDYGSFKSTNKGELYTHDTDTLAELVLIKGDTASIVTNTSTTATNTGTTASAVHLEDAASASGDAGLFALAVRRDTTGAQTSANGDYSELQTWSNGELKVVNISNSTIKQQQVSVTDTATKVPATPLASRKTLMIQNTGANKLWLGSSTVTTSGATAGIEMAPNSVIELEAGPAFDVYMIKNGATGNNVSVLELS